MFQNRNTIPRYTATRVEKAWNPVYLDFLHILNSFNYDSYYFIL